MQDGLQQVAKKIGWDWKEHSYYGQVEAPEFLKQFWGDEAPFPHFFQQLDLTAVVEIACGRGRHIAQALDGVGQAILTDINETNIAACRERFADFPKIRCEVTNGVDLQPVPDGWATAVFSYDAMVHFEPEVIFSYVRDIARVLGPSGRALLHFSNYSGKIGAHYSENPHYRNFMLFPMFEHVAKRSGMSVLETKVVSWGGEKDLATDIDRIVLLQKG